MATIVLPSGNWVVAGRPARPGFLDAPPAVGPAKSSIQFYIPYTGIRPDVAAAAPSGTIWIDVSSSDTAYFEALGKIWGRRETFAVLEHDVICRPDIVEAFEACPEPWCNFSYSDLCHPHCRDAWANHLGCTRFRAELMQVVPDAVSSIPPGELRDWHNVCNGLGGIAPSTELNAPVARGLRALGFKNHWHGVVQHDHWA